MSFGHPELLWLVVALPLAVGLGVWGYARRRRRVAEALGDPALVSRLGLGSARRFPITRVLLLGVAAAAMGVAIADPRWGLETVQSHTRSFNAVLTLDVSKSMYARDVAPDRLGREQLLSRLLLRELPGDRMGIVVFAGRAYILSPLTVDHAALELFVDALDPEMVSQGGTSLASAIREATGMATADKEIRGDRAIVLMTDGEALEEEDDVIAAAKEAARAGVRIFAAGLGTEAGAPIPDKDPDSGRQVGWKRDLDGQIVVSKLNVDLLRRVADLTNGRFIAVDEPGSTAQLVGALDALKRAPGAGGGGTQQAPQFEWFVGVALALVSLDALLANRRRREEATEVEHESVAAGAPASGMVAV